MIDGISHRKAAIMCQISQSPTHFIMKHLSLLASIVLIFGSSAATAQEVPEGVKQGIEGKKAPPLGVTEWIQLPDGKDQFDPRILADKVVVLFLFQSTCEACHKREFPVLQELVKEFKGNDGVVFLAIQTPFEKFTSNTELQLKPTAEKYDLDIPFGHLPKTKDLYSINVAYETGGTPWWVVINREGIVEFNGFTMDPEIAKGNIRKLIAGEAIPE